MRANVKKIRLVSQAVHALGSICTFDASVLGLGLPMSSTSVSISSANSGIHFPSNPSCLNTVDASMYAEPILTQQIHDLRRCWGDPVERETRDRKLTARVRESERETELCVVTFTESLLLHTTA